jgi:diguanylate cyclase (GGDEF)-like protein
MEETSAAAEAALGRVRENAAGRGDEDGAATAERFLEEHRNIQQILFVISGRIGQVPGDQVVALTGATGIEAQVTDFLGDLDQAIIDSRTDLLTAQDADQASQTIWSRVIIGVALGWAALVIGSAAASYSFILKPLERERLSLLQGALDHERQLARFDSLTGVLKHAALIDDVNALIARGVEPLALAMVDVDGLKAVNDTFGHQLGDAVLKVVARTLPRQGAIVGRYGGDEFIAVLPECDRVGAEQYRDQVLEELAKAGITDPATGSLVPPFVSFGLAVYPDETTSLDDLIRLADHSMYTARRQRPLIDGHASDPRFTKDDRTTRMVGEIVPFLTSPGELHTKLRLVAQRLSVGAGYDAVSFVLPSPGRATATTFAGFQPEALVQWNRDLESYDESHPLFQAIAHTGQPIIVNDPWTNEGLSESQRAMLKEAGLRSALVSPMIWQERVVGVVAVASKREQAFGASDAEFVSAVATQVTAIVQMARLLEDVSASASRLEQAHVETVMMLAAAAEAHDDTTGRHLQGLRTITTALALEMGHNREDAEQMGLAAVLHDIGKLRVPRDILTSESSLSDDERAVMQQHSEWGASLLRGREGFDLATDIAACHHERWDGSGYPLGLSHEAIPVGAQIVSVADAFDAMTNDRPYRKRMSAGRAMAELEAWAGTQFSPRVVEAFRRLYDRGVMHELTGDHEVERAAA